MTTPPTAERPAERASENAVEQAPAAKGRRARRNAGRARPQPDPARLLGLLTPREAQVLARLAAGDDAAQLAAALGIAPATARTHLHRTMRKIGARSPAEAAATAAALLGVPDAGPASAPKASPKASPNADRGVGASSAPAGNTAGEAVSGDTATAPRRTGTTACRPAAGGPTDGQVTGGSVTDRPVEEGSRGKGPAQEEPGREGPAKDETAAVAVTKAGPPGAGRPSAERPAAGAPGTVDARPGTPKAATRERGTPNAGAPGAGNPKAGTPKAGTPKAGTPKAGPAAPAATGGPAAGRSAGPSKPVRPNATPSGPTGPDAARPAGAAGAAAPAGRTSAARSPVRPPAGGAGPGFEELYESAHTRLVQQVFLLTGARRHTLHCVHLAFGAALRVWPEVSALPDPEAWVRARACEAALSPWHRAGRRRAAAVRRPWRRQAVRPADESQAVLPDHDRLSDQDRALLKALRRLSRPQRRALVLHDGIGLPAAAVAVEVESSTAAAEGRVLAARVALAAALPELVGADPADPGFGDRLSALLYRAGVRGCPEPHRPPVPALSARHRLRTAGRTGGAALVTLAMATAVGTTLFGAGPGELFKPSPPVPHPVCTNAQNGSAGPAAPGGVPPGLRTAWCSFAPGRAAVLGPPPLPALSLWGPVGTAARGSTDAAGPPGPDGAAAARCTVLTPRPCAARPQSVPPLPAPFRAAGTR
ncbi:hypothetical protein GCM10010495_24210 [Kitasatospora herbaricolor]|uniref:LuxR C-terminal-related transcriptional regulator n=1 Tax=Kitasatospora herbaricolor TaxID=68217 RepID=UPI0017487089|nr:LuxR C-terminal-related transcriptional regulator [Kitasatospora herbaricolor]MDQ0308796.1 DNA-binding CsgD family transcriptional regulator [Kitasatospora herbaricolor]GGV10163.1 hypothetical protein GCM10010495_24210 [Kitasatospora herbaricolor]